MFKPWAKYKFNYIINDISGISSTIAKNLNGSDTYLVQVELMAQN